MQPGVYHDISNHDYHAGEGVSKSQLDDIDLSPSRYIWRKNAPVDTDKLKALDLGTDFHCAILEPDRFNHLYRVAPEVNRRTTAGKEEEKTFFQQCEAEGVIAITREDDRKIQLMRGSIMAHPTARELVQANGYAEASIYWNDPLTGVLCRCRPDKYLSERNWIIDIKTTADMSRFRREFYNLRYHVQDAFYSDGYASVFGETPVFVFVVTSTTIDCGRYPTEVFYMPPDVKQAGRDAYQQNLETFAHCIDSGEWPGIHALSLPSWAKEFNT